MAVYSRTTLVDATLDAVWGVHTGIDGLVAQTPPWLGLRVESITPRGEPIGEGTEVELSTRPFGVLPRTTWRTRIIDWTRGADHAMFRDETVSGPVHRWVHTHWFFEVALGTVVHDRVDYRLGGAIPDSVLRVPLGVLFASRHRRLRQLVE